MPSRVEGRLDARTFKGRTGPLDQMVERVTQRVAFRAKLIAPVGDTDELVRNIIVRPEGAAGWAIVVNVPYARFVIRGTKPHIIVPRTKRALRFEPERGTVVFAAKVKHPGTAPNNFLLRAAQIELG